MELFLHGGVSFAPYRAQFEKLIPRSDMNYLEIYNMRRIFSFNDDLKRDDMLSLDTGIFMNLFLGRNLVRKKLRLGQLIT